MNKPFSGTIQVNRVWSGTFGGAVFTGKNIKNNFNVKCRADYKIITRSPEKGEFWKVEGVMIKTDDYGYMIKVAKCNLVPLPSVQYLSHLLIKHPNLRGIGLGKSRVKKLIKEIGSADELLRLLNAGNSSHLSDVIAKPIAEALCKRWLPLKSEMELASFFMENNIDSSITKKIIKVCRFNTLTRVKKNPYSLLAFGVITKNFWKSIDHTAKRLGFTKDSKERQVGAVEQVLYEKLRQGDTAIPYEDLVSSLVNLLGEKDGFAKDAIREASKVRAICFFKKNDITYVQSVGAATIEASLEKHISYLKNKISKRKTSISKLKSHIESYSQKNFLEQGYPITEEQKDAVKVALTTTISVVTGFGGTGKTTVLKAIADVADVVNRPIYILALAGKAKERAREATNRDKSTYTIHGFIKLLKENKDSLDLKNAVIVIDEASMVDISLANKFLNQLRDIDFSLTLVGDSAQLSPVGIGIFFHVCVDRLPTVHLTKVHRQASNSPIHQLAMKYRAGQIAEIPVWNKEQEGVFFVSSGKTQIELLSTLNTVTAIKIAQIITPHAAEYMSDNTSAINDSMQHQHNQMSQGMHLGYKTLKINDPVIVTSNNYDLELYNGTTGVIQNIVEIDKVEYLAVKFKNKIFELTRDQCFELGLELSYGITIHKSQGSEYDAIIICCNQKSKLLERSMVYTALTRSKSLTLFVGDMNVLEDAVMKLPRSETIHHGFNI
jgi:exodeoxyribonuclease V alpha subunit